MAPTGRHLWATATLGCIRIRGARSSHKQADPLGKLDTVPPIRDTFPVNWRIRRGTSTTSRDKPVITPQVSHRTRFLTEQVDNKAQPRATQHPMLHCQAANTAREAQRLIPRVRGPRSTIRMFQAENLGFQPALRPRFNPPADSPPTRPT